MSSFKPATLTVQDMIGQQIEYVRSRPYERLPIVETGVVKEIKHYKNVMYMWVVPDSSRSAKWVSEYDFRKYVRKVRKARSAA